SGRRRHTRFSRDWSSDVCSSDLSGIGLFSEYMNLSGSGAGGLGDLDERDDDDRSDSESVLGEFECLADEIFRTGGIQPSSSTNEIGRASCREREEITEAAVTTNK